MAPVQCPNCSNYQTIGSRLSFMDTLLAVMTLGVWLIFIWAMHGKIGEVPNEEMTCEVCGHQWEPGRDYISEWKL